MYTQDQGNNETISRGMRQINDGYGGKKWLALTFAESKSFATRAGAEKWLAKRGLRPDGSRIGV